MTTTEITNINLFLILNAILITRIIYFSMYQLPKKESDFNPTFTHAALFHVAGMSMIFGVLSIIAHFAIF